MTSTSNRPRILKNEWRESLMRQQFGQEFKGGPLPTGLHCCTNGTALKLDADAQAGS